VKCKMIVAFLLCIVTASQVAFSAAVRDNEPPQVTMALASTEDAQVLADLVEITPVIPRGPRDLLQDYELAMASIAAQLSMDLGTISNAVRTGEVTRQLGEYASGERYQVAVMQFQLFSALHSMLEADIARAATAPTDPGSSPPGGRVLVAIPFSSLQLSSSLVEYLGLTPTQVRFIQRLIDQERPTTEPLMHELRAVSGELGAAIQQRQNNENEGATQKLVARQTRLLKQLMTTNSRLQRRINDVLDPRQRKKLESFKRTGEVAIGEEN